MDEVISVVTNAMNATKFGRKQTKQQAITRHKDIRGSPKIEVRPRARREREFTINGEEEIQRAGYDP